MIISQKRQEANRQNAQQSTGPVTPEGKAAVRLNALTYGLRARSTLIAGEDPEEYKRLWAALEAEAANFSSPKGGAQARLKPRAG